ncbi:MAG: hypothetical protein R3Y63_07480 [Eubacteriales bacterium]
MSEINKEKEGKISFCPYCNSENLKKNGTKDNKQRHLCKDCNKTFTVNTGKTKQYSKLSGKQWKGLLRGMAKNETLSVISEETGLSVPSVWFNRQKVCAMLSSTIENNDIFKDIAECDECYTVSSFKGKRDASFFIDTLNRLPRYNRKYEEKVAYLVDNGYGYLKESDPERWNKLLDGTRLGGISNEQVCTVTCKDRSGNLLIEQTCLGRLEIQDAKEVLKSKFAPDSILVTDCLSSYQKFARDEEIHLEQVNSKEHKKGPFSLAHINALHSGISSHWNRLDGRTQATKYHDYGLFFYWWLEKNRNLKINEKVDVLFKLIKTTNIENITYEDIRNKPLTLNTKGFIPEYV